MADYIKGLFGGQKPTAPSPSIDDDFEDFGAPDPTPAFNSPSSSNPTGGRSAVPTLASSAPLKYTKWYRVWERTSASDFYAEATILPFVVMIVGLHIWGRRKNRRKARSWVSAHAPILEKEYAAIGVDARRSNRPALTFDEAQPVPEEEVTPLSEVLQEKTAQEYIGYATGRQNVAFMDIQMKLFKRYNPLTLLLEFIFSFLFESIRAPRERIVFTTYTFDGKERDLVPVRNKAELEAKDSRFKGLPPSRYDAFVWAIAHKDGMKGLRDERYDISLTATKEHAKLPIWATTMSESAEITEQLLSKELVQAIEQAGDAFEHLIVSDQPVDKPTKLDETTSSKRITLSLRLPSSTAPFAYKPTMAIFNYFLRLPDTLVSSAHFRPEVGRKIGNVREEEIKKLKRANEGEKAEDRRLESEKKKKELRDSRLKGLSADEQRKFLEKEREKGHRKQEKKMSRKA